MHTIVTKLEEASVKWYEIGLALKLRDGSLQNIKRSHRDNPSDCLLETMRLYLQTTSNPNWDDIVNALKQPTVGYAALAEEIEKEFGELCSIVKGPLCKL